MSHTIIQGKFILYKFSNAGDVNDKEEGKEEEDKAGNGLNRT